MGFTLPDGHKPKGNVNAILITKLSGATDLYHGLKATEYT